MYPRVELEGFTEEPEYPPIQHDGTTKGVRDQIRLDWYEDLKKISTVEGKLYEIDRQFEHYMAHILNYIPVSNSLPLIKYLTQTVFVNSLPESYKTSPSASEQINEKEMHENSTLHNRIRQSVLDQVALDKYESARLGKKYFMTQPVKDNNRLHYLSNTMIQNIANRVKRIAALELNQQLVDYQIDLCPAIRSWWYHSGFQPPNNKIFYKSRKDEDGNINQIIQLDGAPAMNMRGEHFIEPVVSLDDSLVTDTKQVEKCRYPLKNYDALFKFRRPVALPGFWYEDEPRFDFPHTSFLNMDCLNLRNQSIKNQAVPLKDDEDCLNGQAVLTAFGWLNSISMYHGYTPFQELDYPFTCQIITTNGQDWLFNVYQMNSHTFHRDLGGPKRNNVCWSSGLMKLYEKYENDNFKGVNDDVIDLVIKFFGRKTSQDYTNQLDLRSHLGEDTRSDEEKELMRDQLREYYINRRNRHLLAQWAVPLYEHIFFRSPECRHTIRHVKPKWRPDKPKMPKIFE